MQKQNLRKFVSAANLAVFVVMATVGMLGFKPAVQAANLNADQVLGQVNADGSQNFTQILADTVPSIKNDHGFDFSFELDAYPDITLDATNHRLFVSDSNNNRILVFDLDVNNDLLDYKADAVLGQENFFSGKANRGAVANEYTLNRPGGLVYDNVHNYLFVVDALNNRVLVYDVHAITNGEAAIQVLGQSNTASNSAASPATDSSLNQPYGIAFDSARGLLFIGDTGNNRVLVYDVNAITDGESAIRVLGQADFTTSSYNRGGMVGADTLSGPLAVEYSQGQKLLFVSDSNNSRVLVYDLSDTGNLPENFADGITNGEPAVHVLGQNIFTSNLGGISENKIQYAGGISVDDVDDHLYVSDPNAHRVLVFDITNIIDGEDAVNVIGQLDFTHNSSGNGATRFTFPRNVHYGDNKLYVVDTSNHRVLVFNTSALNNFLPAQAVLGQLKSGMADFEQNAVNSGSTNEYGFNRPLGVTKDEVGHKLFVADAFNNRVLVFNLNNNNELTDYQADFVLGQADFSGSVANRNSLAAANTLSFPTDVQVVATANLLLVSDQNNNRVLAYNLADGITNGEDAVSVLGQADFDHNDANRGGAVGASTLQSPRGMSLNSVDGILYLVDATNNRVLAYNLADGITNGEDAVSVLGQADFTHKLLNQDGSTDSVSVNTLWSPNEVFFDSIGNKLYVSDAGNNRVLAYNLADGITNGEDAVSVLGQADFQHGSANRGGSILAGTLNSPYGIVSNSDDTILYVVDSINNRVLAYNLADGITNGEDAIEVIGSENFTGDATVSNRAKLNFPAYLIYSSTNNSLQVSDLSDHRLVSFDLLTLPQTNLPAGNFGVAYNQTINLAGNTRGSVSYAVSSGALPGGVLLDASTGVISGTPTATGNFPFTIKAIDTFLDDNGVQNTYSAYQRYSVTVPASFHLPVSNLANGVVGTAYNQAINAAIDAQGDVVYGLTAGSLPNGLSFDAASRVISGTPTTAGTYNFTITATDTAQFTDSENYTIVINAAPVAPPVGGGGGGGGGAPVFNAPIGGFSVTVDSIIPNTSPAQVNLKLNGGTAARMAISNTADFAGVSQQVYQTTTPFTLTAGSGLKIIYVRFYDTFGTPSSVVQATTTISESVTIPVTGGEVLGEKITRLDELVAKLKFGQISNEVMELQTLLKNSGYFIKTFKPTKYYGSMTKAAVQKYLANKNGKPVVDRTISELVKMTKPGQKSDLVRQLQTELKKLGFFPASQTVTNYYGAITKAAVAKYLASQK